MSTEIRGPAAPKSEELWDRIRELCDGSFPADRKTMIALIDNYVRRQRPPASDHALVLHALTRGLARWEPMTSEIAIDGLRYATTLDERGCPRVSHVIRNALLRATRNAPKGAP